MTTTPPAPQGWLPPDQAGPWGPYRDLPTTPPPPEDAPPPAPVAFVETVPTEPTPSGEPSAAGSGIRARLRAVVVTVVVLALVVWLATITSLAGRGLVRPDTAATGFVPIEGQWQRVVVDTDDGESPGSVEHSEGTGLHFGLQLPLSMVRYLERPEDMESAQWWRERVTAENGTERVRARRVSDRGVLLFGQSGTHPMVFSPALVEIPADIHEGQQWHSQGRGVRLGDDGQGEVMSWRNQSSASRPDDPDAAHRGCLQIESITATADVESSRTLTEHNLWCPGEGIVSSKSTWGEEPFGFRPGDAPFGDELTSAPLPGVDDIMAWQPEAVGGAVEDEPLYGRVENIGAVGQHVLVDDGGYRVMSADSGLFALEPRDGASPIRWQARPGGAFLSVAGGALTVVSTTRREVVAYDSAGVRRWVVSTQDVVAAPATAVGEDRLVFGSLDGTVHMVRLATGEPVWQRAVSDVGIGQQVRTDGRYLAFVDAEPTLRVLDAATGEQLWDVEFNRPVSELAVVDGMVYVSDGESLFAWDAASGDFVWTETGLSTSSELTVAGDLVALRFTDGRVRFYDRRTGQRVGDTAEVAMVRPVRDGFVMLTADRVTVWRASARGADQVASWPRPSELTDMVVGSHRIWLSAPKQRHALSIGERR